MASEIEDIWADDLMGREGVAKFLTQHVDGQKEIKVLNINAPWGAGKTFFIERWHKHLSKSRACVYFNAWQHDYTGDAFVSLSAVLHDELSQQLYLPDKGAEVVKAFGKTAARAIVAATPVIAKGILKKAVGVEYSDLEKTIGLDDAVDAAEVLVETLIKNNKNALAAIDGFKKSLAAMADSASTNASMNSGISKSPVYIFIDELDRCRPTFAIELLERVKHFFDVDGCKFIVATDKQQLACSVKSVYGESFDSERYLRRFFDAEYMLDSADMAKWVKFNVKFESNPSVDGVQVRDISDKNFNDFIKPGTKAVLGGELGLSSQQVVVLAVARTFKLSLRDLQKCLRHTEAINSNAKAGFNILLAFYLVCLREEAVDFYNLLIRRREDDLEWEKIYLKYPSFGLYTGKSNLDIHHFIHEAFGILQDNEPANTMLRIKSADSDPFVYSFYRSMSKHRKEFRSYPALAELAHSLD